jgi:hypothetical protein
MNSAADRSPIMNEGKYDPAAFSEGMGIFEEHLRQTCPEALETLSTPTIGFHYTAGGFIYSFPSEHRESFERISKPPRVRSGSSQGGRVQSQLGIPRGR